MADRSNAATDLYYLSRPIYRFFAIFFGFWTALVPWAYLTSRDLAMSLWVLALFGSLFVLSVRSLRNKDPVLSLDAAGISYPRRARRGQPPIPWTDVESIKVLGLYGRGSIAVTALRVATRSHGSALIGVGVIPREDRRERLPAALAKWLSGQVA